MDEKMRQLAERYDNALHAVQTTVATQIMRLALSAAGADPKHLRVGVNSALVDVGALTALLIKKGIITDEERMEALTVAMEDEADRMAKDTRTKCGLPDFVKFQ